MATQSEAVLKYGTSGVSEMVRDLQQILTSLRAVEKGAKATNDATSGAAGSATPKLADLRQTLTGVAGAYRAGLGPATAFYGAIAAGGAAATLIAVREAALLEEQIDKVSAVLVGGQAVRQQLEDAAIAAGAKSAFSAREAGQAMEYLAMAGFSARDAIAAVPGVLSLAAAGSTELARTADISSNILTGYGKTAKDLAAVNDVLVGTFTRSNVNLEQLGEAFKYVAPIAKASGQDFELMAAAIGRLGDAGIQGSQAGTTLRQSLIRLQEPPKRARAALQELGIETKDAAGQLLQLDDILGQLSRRGASVGQIAKIFGVESAAGISALVQQGPGALRTFAEDLKRVQGIAAQIERVKLDNLAGQLKIAQGGAETLAASLGKTLLPELTETVKVTNDYLQSGVALAGVQRELARTSSEQRGSLSTLARDGLAVADTAATKLVQTLSALVYVTTALVSPLDTLGKKTGWWAVQAESARDSASGLVSGLADLVQIASVGTAHMPVFGQALGGVSAILRTLSADAGDAAEAIQAATDKRRSEDVRAGLAIVADAGLSTWRVLEGAARSYGKTAIQVVDEEALRRAELAEEAQQALSQRLTDGRYELQIARAQTPLARARAELDRERSKLGQQLADGTLKAVEYEQRLAIAKASYTKAAQDAAKASAKERADLERRVELAGYDLALVTASDDRERSRLTAARARAQIERDLREGKIVEAEADARRAAVDAEERKATEEAARKRREEVDTAAKRVELARLDLGISRQTDERERARLESARALAELEQGPQGGVADEEERAAKRAQIERTLRDKLAELDKEQAEERKKALDLALAEATKAGDGVRAALSGLSGEDPFTRQLKGIGEMAAGVAQLTLQLDALAEAEAGAGAAYVAAMRTAGPAVTGALEQMGASQRVLSGVKAAFYAAEAVGQASLGNIPGALTAGVAAAMHAAAAAGGSGGGGGAGAVSSAAGREAGRAPEGSFAAPQIEQTQRQQARYIAEELSRGKAGGDVNISIDLSGSTTLETSPEIQRRLAGAMRSGLRQEGIELDDLLRGG